MLGMGNRKYKGPETGMPSMSVFEGLKGQSGWNRGRNKEIGDEVSELMGPDHAAPCKSQ
jgi:hypothetical protein